MNRKIAGVAAFAALLSSLGIASIILEKKAAAEAAGVEAPRFEVDPL